MLKLSKTMLALSLSCFSVSALAGHKITGNDDFYDQGKVISAEPVYELIRTTTPVKKCHSSYQRKRHSDSATPTIVGAIIGGAIGNAIGHNKSNKRIGTVAGVVLGGSIGNDIGQNKSHGYEEVVNCHYKPSKITQRKEFVGYQVSYKYRGEVFETFTQQHPGKRIKLKVQVIPVE